MYSLYCRKGFFDGTAKTRHLKHEPQPNTDLFCGHKKMLLSTGLIFTDVLSLRSLSNLFYQKYFEM